MTLTSQWVIRLDIVLLPIMMAGFFTLQMDRGNLANVLTSTIVVDLKITTDQINYGSQMLLAAIVLLELPSNILMQYVSTRRIYQTPNQ